MDHYHNHHYHPAHTNTHPLLTPPQGYILGGLMWFSIPFTLATSLGLASVALDLPITKEEAGAGLVPPAVAVYILGKSGAVWITIMLVRQGCVCVCVLGGGGAG